MGGDGLILMAMTTDGPAADAATRETAGMDEAGLGATGAGEGARDGVGAGRLSGCAFAVEAARLAHDDKCGHVLVLDVTDLSQVTDYLVIASGTSDRQMATVLQHIMELGKEHGVSPFGRHTDTSSMWFLADFVDVVVHLFEPNARAHYDLEMLWGDAARIAWQRPDQIDRDHAGVGV